MGVETFPKLNSNELNSSSHSVLWDQEAVVGQLQNSGIFVGISWQ